METRRGYVSGRVQGVWYRAFTREQAEAAGVTGRACNLPDGRVEVILQGTPAALARVAEALLAGPPHARVAAIDWEGIDCEPLSGFSIG